MFSNFMMENACSTYFKREIFIAQISICLLKNNVFTGTK